MRPTAELRCPCGSGDSYQNCCGPLHDNRVQAATAEQLMRSRYSAYALGRLDHVFRTWHPRTRPADVRSVSGLGWTGLTIVETEGGGVGDDEGVVEFRAGYRTADGPGVQHERSRFRRRAGRWFYLDGEVDDRSPRCTSTRPACRAPFSTTVGVCRLPRGLGPETGWWG